MKNKKAAIELSMATIVVLVLAMSMLILGLVLIKTIFTGAKYNVDQMNDKVKDEISKLFVEDQKIVVYLAGKIVLLKQGESWGVAFVVKNLKKGSADDTKFTYETKFEEADCKAIKEKEAMSWIGLGKSGTLDIPPGETNGKSIRITIPEGVPLCKIRYNIIVKNAGEIYTSDFFDVEIKAK